MCLFPPKTLHALCIADGIDGKQARRTGTAGPTGELFDHGLDSWSTMPFTITIFSIFGRGAFRWTCVFNKFKNETRCSVPPIQLLGILISVQLVFYATHWEKYNTGLLFLSWGYDLSQYVSFSARNATLKMHLQSLVLLYLITYIGGYEMWRIYVVPTLGITFAHVLTAFFYISCIASVAWSLYNIYQCIYRFTNPQ